MGDYWGWVLGEEGLFSQTSEYLSNFAHRDEFFSELATAFGSDYELELATQLQQTLLNGEFLSNLEIQLLPSATLQGALGAYASEDNTIYLSQELLISSSEQAVSVLLEEVGHAIDQFLNLKDSAGDEGAIFASLVQREALSDQELTSLREEDDRATLEINGELIAVEQAEFTVSNASDSGEGSLRQAIVQANATAGADTITFDSSLSGQIINLTSGQLNITDALRIQGLGEEELTLDAGGNSRIFKIDDGNSENAIEVTIDGLTITGGNIVEDNGGGIFNSENLTLSNSTVSGNSASSDGSSGQGAQDGGSGGGIYNSGTLNLSNSTISGNFASAGGGISVDYGTASIINSTISNNSIDEDTGFNDGGGMSIFGTVQLTNSTISGNSAQNHGGGIYLDDTGTLTVTHSTISGNSASIGGGLYNRVSIGVANVRNSIISGNESTMNNGVGNEIAGSIASSANNLFGNSSQTNAQAFATYGALTLGVDDIIATSDGTNPTAFSDILDSAGLQDNSGLTETIALADNSPAIDAGDNALLSEAEVEIGFDEVEIDFNGDGDTEDTLETDQRGFDRVVNGTVDLGAVEVQDGGGGNQPPTIDFVDISVIDLEFVSNGDFVREILASDPNGDALTFTIIEGNNDVDGDGELPFVIDRFENIGEIFVDDIDDLQLADEFFLTVEVSDGEFTDTGTVDIFLDSGEVTPTANDDSFGLFFENTINLDILSNDIAGDGNALEISDFPTTTDQGGTIELDEIPTGLDDELIYTPNPEFTQGVDSFTYTITNESGETDEATVEINVTAEPTVEVNLELRAIPGQEAQLEDGIQSGDEFLVDVRFLDLFTEDNPSQAVLSGFVDLFFDPNVLQVVEDDSQIDSEDGLVDGIIRSELYQTFRQGTVSNGEGLVDEVGAIATAFSPSGFPEDNRIFSILFTATEDITPENSTTIESQASQQNSSQINVISQLGDQRNQTDFGSLTLSEVNEEIPPEDLPTVGLSQSLNATNERIVVTLTVTTSEPVNGEQTVDFTLSTDADTDNFTSEIPSTITIADGETAESVELTANPDLAGTFIFRISNPSEGIILEEAQESRISINTTNPSPNTAPQISNPLNEISVESGSDTIGIDLFSTFEDSEDADSDLIFTASSTNPSLVEISNINRSSGELFLDFPSTRTGSSDITINAIDSSGFTTSDTFTLTVTPTGETISFEESNDSIETASLPQLDGDTPNLNLAGEIGDNDFGNQDIDLYEIALQERDQLTVDINTNENSSLDSVLRIFNRLGQEIERNDDSNQNTDSFLEFSAETSQTYYIGVSGFGNNRYNPNTENSGSKGSTGTYNLALSLTSSSGENPSNDIISQAVDAASILSQEEEFTQKAFIGDNPSLDQAGWDVDLYQIQLQQGETVTIDIDSIGNSSLDPILRVFNATGGQVPNGFNDNGKAPEETLVGNDPYLEFTAPSSGRYFIGVGDQANDFYSPFTPESGENPGATGAYEINITQEIISEDIPTESTPNDTRDNAIALEIDNQIQGNIGDRSDFITVPGLDVDLYTLSLQGNKAISITLNSTSRLDPVLRLFNAQGEEIAFNDDIGSSSNARIDFQVPETVETEDYLIGVSGFGNEDYDINEEGSGAPFASTGSYQLTISEEETPEPTVEPEIENDTIATATLTELTPDNLGSLKQTNAIGDNTSLEEAGSDVDLFQVELNSNTRLTADIETANFENANFDSLLRIFNEQGEAVAFNDDENSNTTDSFLTFTPTVAETYYVGVSGLGNQGYDPTTTDNRNPGTRGDYEIELTLTEAIPPENPSNDTLNSAVAVELDNNRFTNSGFIGDNSDGDVDLYAVELDAEDVLSIAIERNSDSDLESTLRLFNTEGEEIPLPLNAGDFPNPEVSVEIPEDDTYYIGVSAFGNDEYDPTVADSGTAGSTGEYTITLEQETPPGEDEDDEEEIRPTAENDSFRANANRAAIFNVLGNDSANDDTGVLEIEDDEFPKTTEKGATVELDDQSRLVYTPNPDFGGVDTFTYTVENESGGSAQGTVEVTVNRPPSGASVEVNLEIRAVPGKEDQLDDGLQIGDEFLVDVRFLDRITENNDSQAVTGGYADLGFNPNILQVVTDETVDEDGLVDGIVRDNTAYNLLPKGTVRQQDGLVDEVGASTVASGGVNSLPDENRIFSLHLEAVGGGNTAILASEAGQQNNSSITILNRVADQRNQTNFGEIDIAQALQEEIAGAFAPALNLASTNNALNLQQETITGLQGVIEAMEISVDFQNLNGNSLEEVSVEDEFQIVLSAEDLRPADQELGVFSAFVDLVYDTVLIDVTEANLVAPFESPVIDITESIQDEEGLVDELGGTRAEFVPSPGTQAFATLTVQAQAPGELKVSTEAPEGATALNTLFGVDVALNEGTVYGENTLNIVGGQSQGTPDLEVTRFDAITDHVLGGETTVDLTVANRGDGVASGFQVEIVYYTADNEQELATEEPVVVKTLAFDELAAEEEISETAEVSLPIETLLAEALADDPSRFGEPLPRNDDDQEVPETSNNIDYLGVRIKDNESSGEDEAAFANNGITGEEGVDVDDIAYFPWDFLNNDAQGIVQGGEDDLISDGEVTTVDANSVFNNIGEIIETETQESIESNPPGLDLTRMDFDLDGALSPVDAVRVVNRVGYELNPAINDDPVV